MLSEKMKGKPDWTVSGQVAAPPAKVSTLLLRLDAGLVTEDSAPLIATTYRRMWKAQQEIHVYGGPRDYYASLSRKDARDVLIEVDRSEGVVAMRGHWWYGGTHSIEPDGRGSVIVHRVWNIAEGVGRLAVPLANRGLTGQMRQGMRDLLQLIGDRLHVRAGGVK